MKKKFTSVLLAVVLLFSNTLPAFASENQTTSEAGSKEATVLYDMSADYTITLPKKITLNSTKQSEYSVKVEGDIPSSERVYVSPVDAVDKEDGFNFYMQNQNENSTDEDVLATVTQSKVYWNFQDVSDGVEVTDNTVTAEDLKAGKWKGTFTFEINLKSVTSIDVTAKDSDGNDLNASAEAIIGEEKDNLLDQLVESGLVDSAEDVDALIDVKSDNFDDLADATFDVSNIAQEGDKIVILHYDETKGEWEYIGEDTVGEDGTVSGDFTSFSPIAFVVIKEDGTMHVHNWVAGESTATCTENGEASYSCECGRSYTGSAAALGHIAVDGYCTRCGERVPGLYSESGTMTASWDELLENNVITVTEGSFKVKTKSSIVGKLVIDDSVTSFKTSAITNCTALTGIVIPDSVTSLIPTSSASFSNALEGCTSLSSIIVDENNPVYDSRDNCNAIIETASNTLMSGCKKTVIPNSVISIGNRAFYSCTAINSITIPDGVTTIGEGAFSGCTFLAKVKIADSVTTIGKGAFANCTNLMSYSLTLPNNLISIGDSAFSGCTALYNISIPDSVISIGKTAFYGCTDLAYVYIPSSVTTIPSSEDYGLFQSCSPSLKIYCEASEKQSGWGDYWNCYDDTYELVTIYNISSEEYKFYSSLSNVREVTIPDGFDKIPDKVFWKLTRLTKVNIPSSVTSIGESAFYGCTGLRSVTMSDGVTTIGQGAFKGCTSLSDITISDSVTTIGYNAFSGCTKLSTIYIPSSVTTITTSPSYDNPFYSKSHDSPFFDCSSSLQIYCEASEAQSGWGTYWNRYSVGPGDKLSVTYGISREDYEANYK